MKRYWVSWYSGNYHDEGCTAPPFQFWITGYRSRPRYGMTEEQYAEYIRLKSEDKDAADEFLDKHSRDTCTICAMIDAENESQIWESISKYFPDQEYRFCEQQENLQVVPGNRFPGFENRTML